MYKVFVNDCLLILTDAEKILTDLPKVKFVNDELPRIVNDAFHKKIVGFCLISNNLSADWDSFKSFFKIEKAAGGKVLNNKEEVLFIYRFDKWDLPKGKLEKHESIAECAVREVGEECGITGLIIENKLETTYHVFERKGKTILKITYWFLMKTNFKGKLIPQIEEGIQQAVFKNEEETKEALKNTYGNIKLLF